MTASSSSDKHVPSHNSPEKPAGDHDVPHQSHRHRPAHRFRRSRRCARPRLQGRHHHSGMANHQATFWGLVVADSDLTGMRKMVETYGDQMSPHFGRPAQQPWAAEQLTPGPKSPRQQDVAPHGRLRPARHPNPDHPALPRWDARPEEIDGRTVSSAARTGFAFRGDMTGQPAASCPAGLTEAGLPNGVQIIGRHFADASVLAASAAFEFARPWSDKCPQEYRKPDRPTWTVRRSEVSFTEQSS